MKHAIPIFTLITAPATIIMLFALDKIACRTEPGYGWLAQVITLSCVVANGVVGGLAALAYARD